MGMIQEHSPNHNIDEFTYEYILRDTSWLSDCNWMFNESKSVEYSVL
jgi:hypothetical protein